MRCILGVIEFSKSYFEDQNYKYNNLIKKTNKIHKGVRFFG